MKGGRKMATHRILFFFLAIALLVLAIVVPAQTEGAARLSFIYGALAALLGFWYCTEKTEKK
jgi:F0F1-type ATP synthase assembly protein I